MAIVHKAEKEYIQARFFQLLRLKGCIMGGISVWQLLIIVAIVVLLFGTKKLRTLGADLGESVKGFKKAMADEPKSLEQPTDAAKAELEKQKEQA